ncbi:MAG: DUF2852 domain-containing protein [Pseudomonadota bacterium]
MDRIIRGLKRAEEQLDAWGQGAWIAAFVLGFILFWPIGLAILGYSIWSGRMGCWKNRRRKTAARTSGNTVFDTYREETMRRLEEDQTAFEGFMERLRRAKDQAEFDQFMRERRESGGTDGTPSAA